MQNLYILGGYQIQHNLKTSENLTIKFLLIIMKEFHNSQQLIIVKIFHDDKNIQKIILLNCLIHQNYVIFNGSPLKSPLTYSN